MSYRDSERIPNPSGFTLLLDFLARLPARADDPKPPMDTILLAIEYAPDDPIRATYEEIIPMREAFARLCWIDRLALIKRFCDAAMAMQSELNALRAGRPKPMPRADALRQRFRDQPNRT